MGRTSNIFHREITQNSMIDKMKSSIFNYDLILSITINANIFS
jgi:hypothetical protein